MEAPKVQHVTKASSDELLRKFSEMESDSDYEVSSAQKKRRKTCRKKIKKKKEDNITNNKLGDKEQSNESGSFRVIERKSLLPPHQSQRARQSGALFGYLRVSRSRLRGCRDFRNKSVLCAIEKTFTKAVRGASKVFMDKHYNRHRLLINDIV